MLQYMSACVYEPVFLVFLNTTNKHASSSTSNTILHIHILYILYIYIYIYRPMAIVAIMAIIA